MNCAEIESLRCVKHIGVTIAFSLKFSQQWKEAAGKDNIMLGFINRKFSFRNKDAFLPLFISLVRQHLEYTVQFWSPHHAKDLGKLEAVQEERLAQLILFSLEKRRLRGNNYRLF